MTFSIYIEFWWESLFSKKKKKNKKKKKKKKKKKNIILKKKKKKKLKIRKIKFNIKFNFLITTEIDHLLTEWIKNQTNFFLNEI